jgi:hypothetical protein
MAQSPETASRQALDAVQKRDYQSLSRMLRDAKFLAALDRLQFDKVMKAIAAQADPQAADLAHTLAKDSTFLADPDRLLPLLNILGAVKPMSQQTVDVFRRANDQGYFATDAILLARNMSPLAMQLFEEMMLNREMRVETRIDSMRFGIIPGRTSLPVLTAAEHILSRTNEERLANGIVETLFDFRTDRFRPDSVPAAPPAWETADKQALTVAARIVALAKKRRIAAPLRQAVDRESALIQKALSAK